MRGIPRPCKWNGIEYPTIAAAAAANGVTRSVMFNRIARGMTHDHQLRRWTGYVPCEWNGVQYPSIDAAARDNYISGEGMWYRIKVRGYTSDADLLR